MDHLSSYVSMDPYVQQSSLLLKKTNLAIRLHDDPAQSRPWYSFYLTVAMSMNYVSKELDINKFEQSRVDNFFTQISVPCPPLLIESSE